MHHSYIYGYSRLNGAMAWDSIAPFFCWIWCPALASLLQTWLTQPEVGKITTLNLFFLPYLGGHGVQGQICGILTPASYESLPVPSGHTDSRTLDTHIWGGRGGSGIRSMSSMRPIRKCRCPPLDSTPSPTFHQPLTRKRIILSIFLFYEKRSRTSRSLLWSREDATFLSQAPEKPRKSY